MPRSILAPLALVMGVSVASFGVNRSLDASASQAPIHAQAASVGMVVISGLLLLASVSTFRDTVWLKRLVGIFFVLGCLRIALALPPAGSLRSLSEESMGLVLPDGPLGSMFWTWLMALAFGQLVLNRSLSPAGRGGLLLTMAGAVYVTFISGRDWLSGWLPGFIACLVIVFLWKPRWALLALGVILFAIMLLWQPSGEHVLSPDNAYSLSTRTEAAAVLSKLALENPILGLGPANYYHLTQRHAIRGWYVKFSSHNNYIDLFLQFGILGVTGFVWLLGSTFLLAVRLRNGCFNSFERAFLYGAAGGLAGSMVAAALGDWVIPFVYNVGVAGFQTSILAWIWMGGVVALAANLRCSANQLPARPARGREYVGIR